MKQKDELIDALRERLSDLEAPVDPGLWAGIQARLAEAAIASGSDPVTQLFRDGLKDAEAPVDSGVWSNISNQLGHPAAAGTVSVGAWVGGGIAAAVVVGGLWWGLSSNGEPAVVAEKQPLVIEQAVEPAAQNAISNAVIAEPTAEQAKRVEGDNETSSSGTLPQPSSAVPQGNSGQPSQPVDEVLEQPAVPEVATTSGNNTVEKGPNYDKVQEIMARAEQEVNENPAPAITPDPQVPERSNVEPENETDQPEEQAPRTEEASLFIPNVFTPNNDGVNDRLEVSATGMSDIRVSIYSASSDRLMYRATDLTPWDGRDPSGVLCPEGYYFYAIEATGPDGKTITKGTVVRLNTH